MALQDGKYIAGCIDHLFLHSIYMWNIPIKPYNPAKVLAQCDGVQQISEGIDSLHVIDFTYIMGIKDIII